MPARLRLLALLAALLVPSAASLVHAPSPLRAQALGGPAQRARPTAILTGKAGEGLPQPVAEMREAILEAIRSRRLEDLRPAIELNELKPVIGDGSGEDPIATLKRLSTDGEGRDILAALDGILAATWAAVPMGTDIENNRIYVWPSFAATGIATLGPEESAALSAIVPGDQLESMQKSGIYTYWRLGIAADGTWHSFSK